MNEDKVVIVLKELRNEFLQRIEELEDTYRECGHSSICNRISQLHEDLNSIDNKIKSIDIESFYRSYW